MLLVRINPKEDFRASRLNVRDALEEREDHMIEEGDVGVDVVASTGRFDDGDGEVATGLQSRLSKRIGTCLSNSM